MFYNRWYNNHLKKTCKTHKKNATRIIACTPKNAWYSAQKVYYSSQQHDVTTKQKREKTKFYDQNQFSEFEHSVCFPLKIMKITLLSHYYPWRRIPNLNSYRKTTNLSVQNKNLNRQSVHMEIYKPQKTHLMN